MKYPLLYQTFNKHINLPVESYLDIENRLVRKTLVKKEFLIKEGKIIKYLPFINDGLMVNYRVNENGERYVLQIGSSGGWLGDLYSFFSGNPTRFNIQAYRTTELLMISHETFEYMTTKYPVFEKFFRLVIQNAYVKTIDTKYRYSSLSAETRYLELIKNVPSILDDIPHYLIASYLNIKPQSLSRIRKGL